MDCGIPNGAHGRRRTIFDLDCSYADGSFRIGPRRENLRVETYEQALAALRAMEVARWRRPSATTGIHGLVTGVRWVAATDG